MKSVLSWNSELGYGDVLTILGFVATGYGLYLTYSQLRQSAAEQRAQFLLSLTERYFAESEARSFYYKIDHDQFVFDQETFARSDEERCLDQLIYTFDIVGQMVRTRTISSSEARIFAFQASRVLNNVEVKKYLGWLNGEYEKEGRPIPAHSDALYLVETLRGLSGAR